MKTALITGVSGGIGYAAAKELAKNYDYVAAISRGTSGLEDIGNIHIFTGSVTDFGFVEETVRQTVRETGSIDLLINTVNLSSVFNTCHAAVPHMVHQKAGRIINISSVWGLAGASCEVAYSATKGGINAFTKALAKELAPSGIAVNAIAFGAVDTRMNSHLSPEEKMQLEDEIPAGRMIDADEAAEIILKTAELPIYITGDIIKADGGWI